VAGKNDFVMEGDGNISGCEQGRAASITELTDGDEGAGVEIRQDVGLTGRVGKPGQRKGGSVGRSDGGAVGEANV
jgi:hypothetical protein